MYCSCWLLHSLSGTESCVLPLEVEPKSHVLEKLGEKEFHILIVIIAFIFIRVSVIHFPLVSVRQTTEM